MKKVRYFIFLVGLCLFGITFVNAASFKVSTNKTTVVVGNTVNVTVAVNGSDAAGWEYCLNYDTSKFSLTSHSSSCILGGTLAGNKSVTFKLKAKASGSATFSLRDADILDDSANSVLTSKGSVNVTVKTQAEIEASYSTDATLKSLSVAGYDLTPSFNKNTLEYSLEVENDVESVTIKAVKSDSGASVSGIGEKVLTEGVNKFNIVVTAEKGNKKTYVIEINRKELNPIQVSVNGEDYTVVRKADVISAPSYYSSTEVEIQNEMVPAFKSDITGYILVGLKDVNGDISLYRYDDVTKEYVLYQQLSTEGVTLIPLDTKETIEGFDVEKEITVNNSKINVYSKRIDSVFVLVYGMNASNGESGWYKYDTEENTLQRYEKVDVVNSEEELDLYFILMVVFAILSLITILLVIVLISMNSKLRSKNNKLIYMIESSRLKNKGKEENSEKIDEDLKKESEKKVVTEENVDGNLEAKESVKEEKLEETVGLSKREQRRLEKEKEALEQEELRKMQEDFLKTEANDIIVDDVELEESTPVRKRGRKRK